ncbi:Imm1 family immunity protein [uncultured Jatrophihabitans sp.]|uniref:Imm1 family immunity protein n=1 Tax=uncultured Jatrophihabitans sp. TaxID=1610747 RepID=UPI0035CA2593
MAWDGDDGEVVDPSVGELERRIRALDGEHLTIVTLQSETGYFAVGGSAANGLVVFADLGDGDFWSALSPVTSSTTMVTVVAGGQPGDYEERLMTTVEVAIAAATHFLASQALSPEVEWTKN